MKPRSIRCMKFFLTLFNIICILFGLVIMAVCVVNMKGQKSDLEQLAVSRGVLSFLLTLGLALVVTAVLGCIGALRENIKILHVHACFISFLVVIELVVGVGGAVISKCGGGEKDLRVHFYQNITIEDEGSRIFWDNLQSENQCCGVDGPKDYATIHRDIPASCCATAHQLRQGGARKHLHGTCLTEKSYYVRGCEQAVREKKAFKGNIILTTCIFFGLIEIACVLLAIWMAVCIISERRKLQENLQAHFET